jgi:hypothetical protein
MRLGIFAKRERGRPATAAAWESRRLPPPHARVLFGGIETAEHFGPRIRRWAAVALAEMQTAVLEMMRLLGPKDFEMLVDLVFSTSGWRRLGVVGKTQKTLDLDLVLPSIGDRAFVQDKSQTDLKELADYVARLDELGIYQRMFFIYHTGKAETDDERVVVIGPDKLAGMVVDAGLATWLMRKVS